MASGGAELTSGVRKAAAGAPTSKGRSNRQPFYVGVSRGLAGLVLVLCIPAVPAQKRWVSFGPDGKLHYDKTAIGHRISDFSSAGYRGRRRGASASYCAGELLLNASGVVLRVRERATRERTRDAR